MTLVVDVAADGVRLPVARDRLAQLARDVLRAERVRRGLLSVAFVTDRAIAVLNARHLGHLGHRGPTDVISFGFTPGAPRDGLVGDVYIAAGVAGRNARAAGVGVREELARLVVHGVLHVTGWDHPEGVARLTSPMWKRQELLLARHWPGRGA